MTTPTTPEPHDGDDGMRHVWIASAVSGMLLVVALVAAITAVRGSGSDGGDAQASASSAASASPSRSPAAAAPSSAPVSPPPSASRASTRAGEPSSAGPRVVWRGTLRVVGPRARRDLDQVPPRASERDGEPDVRGDWLQTLLEGEHGTQVVVMEPGSRPGPTECRDAAAAQGSDETEPLAEGDVVCVLTAAGRVARLVTTHAAQTSTSPELTFSAVLWDMGGGR